MRPCGRDCTKLLEKLCGEHLLSTYYMSSNVGTDAGDGGDKLE